ncbi:MAG TPA: hypothetical protein VGF69_03405 [Thermoanaerobaculia bacterium]|jgi:hypothetical protein
MTFPGAPAALRGFRLQHLYTLHRLLTDRAVAGLDVQLEGTERLEIFDAAGRPLEAVLVKGKGTAPLAASDLVSAEDSFFRRAKQRLRENGAMVQRIVSFGPVGRTLLAMSAARGATLDGDVRSTLERFDFSRKQIDAFRAVFVVDADLDEAALEREVHASLRETVAGVDPAAAFLYLSGWMHQVMEERRRLTARDVREVLAAAGRFATEAEAQHAEWFTTLVPVQEPAAADENRDAQLDAVDAAFARMHVVVVHGASGEGRTALASRYLQERMPSAWRFQVRAPRDVMRTMRVALALGAHARAVGVPLLVWLDVTPRDLAWTAAVEELRTVRGIRLLVTIGEKAWTRARNSGAMLMAADVALDEEEAEPDVTSIRSGADGTSLASIAEDELEAFLLEAFSRDASEENVVVTAVRELRPRSMAGAAGVLRALLWLGVKRYGHDYAELLAEVQQRLGREELVWTALDPAGLTRFAPSILGFEEALKALPEIHTWYLTVKERRPSSEAVFEAARLWLAAQPGEWDMPAGEGEWEAAAEVLFWAAAWGIDVPRARLAEAALHANVPVAVLADVVFAASFGADDAFERLRTEAITRFQRETMTVTIEVTDDGVMAHWLLPLDYDVDVERETARRLDVLRRLYPAGQTFGGHVYGSVSGEVRRSIPADQFPVPWVLRLHLTFARVAAVDKYRQTWDEYVARIVDLRERIVQLAAGITRGLTNYFRREKPLNIFETGVDAEDWDGLTIALDILPVLPRSAVDEWGFETEGPLRAWSALTPNAQASYTAALSEYASAMRDFLKTSWRVFIAHPQIGRGTAEGREKVAAWSEKEQINPEAATLHLASAVKRLGNLQEEFRARFELHVPGLAAMDRREAETLRTFWAVWYDFAVHPRRRIANAARDSVAAVEARLDERRRALRRRLRGLTLSKTEIVGARERGDAGAGLWLTVDVPRVQEQVNGFAEALAHVIDVLRPPADFNDFDRYALDLMWEYVHLVPLVRGRAVDRKVWTLQIVALPRPGEDLAEHAWMFVPQPVSSEVWAALGLPAWPASAGAEARALGVHAGTWRDTMRHVMNLREVPADEQGKALLASHWRDAIAVAGRAAEGVAAGLGAFPPELLASQPEMLETMQIVAISLRDTIAAAEPLDFAAIEEAVATIGDTIVPAGNALADLWLDAALGVPTASPSRSST